VGIGMDSLQKEMDEINRLSKQIREEVDQMKKNLEMIKWTKPTVEDLVEAGHVWEPWFAWYPVKDINKRWRWRREIYRIAGNTYVDHDNWRWYYYGTEFDVLRSSNGNMAKRTTN
jgi:hypothetical protein